MLWTAVVADVVVADGGGDYFVVIVGCCSVGGGCGRCACGWRLLLAELVVVMFGCNIVGLR